MTDDKKLRFDPEPDPVDEIFITPTEGLPTVAEPLPDNSIDLFLETPTDGQDLTRAERDFPLKK
jgi:hypothetical protein